MIFFVHIANESSVSSDPRAEWSALGGGSFLPSCVRYIQSRREKFGALDGIILLFGKSQFTRARQAATALNTLAFAFGCKIAAVRAAYPTLAAAKRGLRALRAARIGEVALPWYASAPHITKPADIGKIRMRD